MANLTLYSVKNLDSENIKIFSGLYNDFRNRARSDFKFDLEPLDYDDFIRALKNNLLQCLVLYENSIPTGFLIYTTLISYAIELNIIYLNSDENHETKVRYLIGELLKKESELIKTRTITYPLLGQQELYKQTLEEFNFKNIEQTVMKFDFENQFCISKISTAKKQIIPNEFEIKNWSDEYFDKATELIHNNFKYSNDALFDNRFLSYSGTKDIMEKIVSSGYGKFLPEYTKLLLKNGNLIGVCLINVTGNTLLNIPLVAINKTYRDQRFGNYIVSQAVSQVLEDKLNKNLIYTEINVTTDLSNRAAVKMYAHCGFTEDYHYIQSFRPKN